MITTISLALGFIDPDAPKKDPEWTRALKYGAKAKIELYVVDDDGNPVPNAKVDVQMGMIEKSYHIKGQTDTNGVFVAKGKTKGNSIDIYVEKDGYYNTLKRLCFIELGKERQVKNGKWQPYGEQLTVILRKKKNQIPLITNFFDSDYKYSETLNEWIGFDLKENDYVEPHGKGKIADFEVFLEWDGKWRQGEFSGMRMKIRFVEPYSGFYVCKSNMNSSFGWSYLAEPAKISLKYVEYYKKVLADGEIERNLFDKKTYWVIRSRCIVNEKGELISANYSSIFSLEFSRSQNQAMGIHLLRIFNPTPNEINLEPDTGYKSVNWADAW